MALYGFYRVLNRIQLALKKSKMFLAWANILAGHDALAVTVIVLSTWCTWSSHATGPSTLQIVSRRLDSEACFHLMVPLERSSSGRGRGRKGRRDREGDKEPVRACGREE